MPRRGVPCAVGMPTDGTALAGMQASCLPISRSIGVKNNYSRADGWPLSRLAAPLLLSLCAAPALANGLTDPDAIDKAVTTFTGAPIGQPGGARMAVDRRLQMSACAVPLVVSWHTPARSAVRVECAAPTSWRIFVAVNAVAGVAAEKAAVPAIKRGDALTIMVRGRGFSVQQQGEAMDSGAPGDWIFVRTARKAEPLRARIERPGLAVIPAN
jgi:flagellar basal body P-ring formation protein FlgA